MWRLGIVMACVLASVPGPVAAQSGRYVAASDRVLDRKTGLTWQRCASGQRWTGERCAGPPGLYTWDQAAGLTADGWRLPTPAELASLVDPERKRRGLVPTFDPAAFPDMPPGGILDTWTAFRRDCPQNHDAGCGLVVTFGSPGGADVWDRSVDLSLPVRLVTGKVSPPGAPAAGEVPPPPSTSADGRFEIDGDVARDRRTGLLWRRCDEARHMTAAVGCGGVVQRFTLAEALGMGGDGWRLPTRDELLTLIDPIRMRRGQSPYIDQDAFPAGPLDIGSYWTSTRYTPAGDQMWCVDFHIGVPGNCGAYPQGVRLVRRTAP